MNRDRSGIWVPVLCTVLLLIQLAAYLDYFTDDSYIYARFATNLVERGELVFNPGERVHAATSPLWAGLVAGILALGLPVVAGMKALGAVCAVAGLWIGWRLARARANVAEANRHLTVLAEKYPWSNYGKMARIELLDLYLAAGRVDYARGLLESVEPGAELRTDQRLGALAAIAGAENRWDEALDFRRRQWAALPGSGDSDKTVQLWANAAVRAGRVSEALDLLSGFWSHDPDLTASARLMLAEQYRAAGKLEEALGALNGIITLAKARSEPALEALYSRGLLLEQMGLIKQAIETYRRLEQLAGQNSDWLRSARNRLRELQSQATPDSTSRQPGR